MNAWFGSLEISVTHGQAVPQFGETTGNIWMADTDPVSLQDYERRR
jgi:hypothetical protein